MKGSPLLNPKCSIGCNFSGLTNNCRTKEFEKQYRKNPRCIGRPNVSN